MSIRDVIIAINQMEADGIIDRYAIAGAVGATFYLEPVATLDVDVFVAFRSEPGQLLVTPKPIFDYLASRGWSMKGEYVVIATWPVQFLPVACPGESSRRSTSPRSPCRPAAPRTKRGCCSSSRKARLTIRAFRKSFIDMPSLRPGEGLNGNS